MKKAILFVAAIIFGMAGSAFADVKIKTKQTVSGNVSENTTYIKGKRSRTEIMNGVSVTVTQCDLGRDLQINPAAKTYMVNLYDDGTVSDASRTAQSTASSGDPRKGGSIFVTVTIKDTGERKQMFGYTARHVLQTIETDSSPDACTPLKSKMEMDMWVIDAEFGASCMQTKQYRSFNSQSTGCKDKYVNKTVGTAKSGYPLWQKLTSFGPDGKESFSIIQEVIELSKATLDQALFEAPADYREVKDSASLYSSGVSVTSSRDPEISPSTSSNTNPSLPSSNGLASSAANAATPKTNEVTVLGSKKEGTIRVGIANVKTGAVGEGISAADLSTAVRNSLGSYLKGTKIEVVNLEAKLASAASDEARQKECDYIVYATAAHKKGGGGFGGFGRALGSVVSQTGLGYTGAAIGTAAASAIVSAATVSGNVKKKDELTLDINVQAPAGNSALTKQFKAKAQSDGDDIISAIVEQAAQAIVETLGK